MTSWERTYNEVKADLDQEADEKGGVLSKKFIEEKYRPNYRDPQRTLPRIIKQLENAHVIEPINQYLYRYMMNGWGEHWNKVKKDSDEIEARAEAERIMKAKPVQP